MKDELMWSKEPHNTTTTEPLTHSALKTNLDKHDLEGNYSWQHLNNMGVYVQQCKQQSSWNMAQTPTSHETSNEAKAAVTASLLWPLAAIEWLSLKFTNVYSVPFSFCDTVKLFISSFVCLKFSLFLHDIKPVKLQMITERLHVSWVLTRSTSFFSSSMSFFFLAFLLFCPPFSDVAASL